MKTKYSINDIVYYKGKDFTIIDVIFEAVDEGWEAQYTLQGIEKNEIFYGVPEYKIFAVRSPKYRMGDIIKSFHGKTDYKITEIEVPLQFTTYLYDLISLDGRNCIDQATEEYIEQILEKNAKSRNKLKLGDIVKWMGYKDIDFKITSIIDDGKTFCYSLEATSGVCRCNRVREEEISLASEYYTRDDNISMEKQKSIKWEAFTGQPSESSINFHIGDLVKQKLSLSDNSIYKIVFISSANDENTTFEIHSLNPACECPRYGNLPDHVMTKINKFSIGNVVKYNDRVMLEAHRLFVINSIEYDDFKGVYYVMSPIEEPETRSADVAAEKDLVKYASEVIFR